MDKSNQNTKIPVDSLYVSLPYYYGDNADIIQLMKRKLLVAGLPTN